MLNRAARSCFISARVKSLCDEKIRKRTEIRETERELKRDREREREKERQTERETERES